MEIGQEVAPPQPRWQRMVVLIDEYDKPILDNILDADRARERREGLNNLNDITLGKSY